jgi:hypothetical protein
VVVADVLQCSSNGFDQVLLFDGGHDEAARAGVKGVLCVYAHGKPSLTNCLRGRLTPKFTRNPSAVQPIL